MNILIYLIIIFLIISYFKNQNEYFQNINELGSMIVRIHSENKIFDFLEPYNTLNTSSSIGTGFFIDKNIILTAAHVVEDAIKIEVSVPTIGKKKFDVEIVCVNLDYDFAILKTKTIHVNKYFKLADSNKVKSGDKTLALGYPLGQENLKITTGTKSGIHEGMIQTDTAINPGNSGGPLLDEKYEVIGINVSGILEANNVGYAVPINIVKIYKDRMLQSKEKIIYTPILGGNLTTTYKEQLQYLNSNKEGMYILDIHKEGPLDLAGLKEGDLLTKFNNYNIDRFGQVKVEWYYEKISLFVLLMNYLVGTSINIEYIRDGKIFNSKIILQPSSFYKIRHIYPNFEKVKYNIIAGMVFMNLSKQHLNLIWNPEICKYGLRKNQTKNKIVLTNVMKASYVNNLELISPGLILDEINDEDVNTIDEMNEIIKKSNKNIIFKFSNNIEIILDKNKIEIENKFLKNQFNY